MNPLWPDGLQGPITSNVRLLNEDFAVAVPVLREPYAYLGWQVDITRSRLP